MLEMNWLRCIPAISTFDVDRLYVRFSEAGLFPHGRYLLGGYHHHNDIRLLTILYSAPGFLNFVSGYTVFLGPMAGVIVTDVCPLYLEIISMT